MYKKLLLSLVAIATISLSSFGQAPEGFKYQAVVRDAGNTILNNQAVGMQITIQEGSIGGATVYQETFSPTTNGYGLVNLEIGSGTVVSGDFTTIDWSAGPYFIETAADVTGGTSYVVMGTSQLMSVPYALHANTAENVTNDMVDDADADPTNEMNTGVVLNGTDLEVTDGNGTIVTDLSSLQDGVTDADSDSTNEMNTGVVLNGTDLEVTDGNGTIVTDLSSLQDGVNDADNDPLNEIELPTGGKNGQVLAIIGGVVTWVNGPGFVHVGDEIEGGIVFYVDASGKHGLVSAATDQSTEAEWGCYGSPISGADANAVGTGNQNTIDIEAGCSTAGTAADICANLTQGAYPDWFLPSMGELNLMYENIGKGNAYGLGNVGGFAAFDYWSSTEAGSSGAWVQRFSDGKLNINFKFSNYYVRAIRAF
jgi:hypothetical protein